MARHRRRYSKDVQELVGRLEKLIAERDDHVGSEMALSMTDSILDFVEDVDRFGIDTGDLKMLYHALFELRTAFRVFAPYRMIRKVSVFGSARTKPEETEYQLAEEFANLMTRRGYMVITGAGPGIMEAAQGGAGRGRSFGVNIRLPFESEANEHIQNDPKLVHFKYFFTRKVIFLKETDSIVLFPGGFGTHDEGFESLTLVQTGKGALVPLVFVDKPGGSYWRDWYDYVEKHLAKGRGEAGGYIDPDDLSLIKLTDNVEEAVEEVERFYSNFHSTRWVRPRLVVRLQHAVTDEVLDGLHDSFSDLLVEGKFERLDGPLEVESDEPHTASLHRLAFPFDRKSYGRLRQMVDWINAKVDPANGSNGSD